ncbi:hypothetical protein QVO10_01755 [Bacteroides gallinaceum]|uniref:Uncharacterized protein n=1 Tax=Bacteroides gallinaceum TaxID=1462571 RepID=A0ABT7X225_9BACE|nr:MULTISPECIES: hypothetical protein [Bacteroides]MBM6943727.1 hypothetical protein [Bacteroides gallinaceum]MBV4216469.1 hypothetical protein [Bacteroides uniformis]MBV4229511.1 hypothetical protein [Bacteroides uniformis]MCB7403883.1 hypothetical protein [Bacteroides uniformis]MCB7415028.1 hypothetical protein [Bacteroides uniformis]
MFLSIAIVFEGLTSSPAFGSFTSQHRGYFSASSTGKGQPANPVVEIRFPCNRKEDFRNHPWWLAGFARLGHGLLVLQGNNPKLAQEVQRHQTGIKGGALYKGIR